MPQRCGERENDMTDYNDINTYREEINPEDVRRDTLDILAAGVSENDINACLTRNEWVTKGFQMLHRISLRDSEKRECAKFFEAYSRSN